MLAQWTCSTLTRTAQTSTAHHDKCSTKSGELNLARSLVTHQSLSTTSDKHHGSAQIRLTSDSPSDILGISMSQRNSQSIFLILTRARVQAVLARCPKGSREQVLTIESYSWKFRLSSSQLQCKNAGQVRPLSENIFTNQ